MTQSLFELILLAVLVLLGTGLYCLLAMRHLIKVIIGLQLLGKGALLAIIVASGLGDQMAIGQSLAATVIVADTIVAVIGLALAVKVKEHFGTLDTHQLSTLRG